jgi:hypothetical protein
MLQVADETVHACITKTTHWLKWKLPQMMPKGALALWNTAGEPHADVAHDATVSALATFNPARGKFSSFVQAIAMNKVRTQIMQTTKRNRKCRIVLGKTPTYVDAFPTLVNPLHRAEARIDAALLLKQVVGRLTPDEIAAVFSILGLLGEPCNVTALSRRTGTRETVVAINLRKGLLKILRTPGVLSHMNKDRLEAILFRNTPASMRNNVFGRNYER